FLDGIARGDEFENLQLAGLKWRRDDHGPKRPHVAPDLDDFDEVALRHLCRRKVWRSTAGEPHRGGAGEDNRRQPRAPPAPRPCVARRGHRYCFLDARAVVAVCVELDTGGSPATSTEAVRSGISCGSSPWIEISAVKPRTFGVNELCTPNGATSSIRPSNSNCG